MEAVIPSIPSVWRGKFPEVDSWPLMSSPLPWITIFTIYLIIVLKVGPRFMQDRKAFKLTNVTRIYNVYQIAACIFFVAKAYSLGFRLSIGWKCIKVPEATSNVHPDHYVQLATCWWFTMLRASEFFETFVFVLRKKQNQISMLHIYHHISVVCLLWFFMKYHGSPTDTFIPIMNSMVHIIMYTYYLLSSYESCKKLTSAIKSSLTAIQITQLVSMTFHCFAQLFGCGITKLFWIHVFNLIFLVYMFVSFYRRSYISKTVKSS